MDFVRAYPDKETVFIGFFMINKTYQDKGLGSRLVKEATAYFLKDFKKMRLAYVKGNSQAQDFWEKQSFTSTGEKVKQYLYTAIIMEKSLCDATLGLTRDTRKSFNPR